MRFDRGSTVVVSKPFVEYGPEDGYLVLQLGATVFVEFVGEKDEESEWLFGHHAGSPQRGSGWFPKWAVSPTVPRTAPVPPPPPVPEVPASAAVQAALGQVDGPKRGRPPPPPPAPKPLVRMVPPPPTVPPPTTAAPLPSPGPAAPRPPPPPPSSCFGAVAASGELPTPGFARKPSLQTVESIQRGVAAGASLPMHGLRSDFVNLILRFRVVVVDAATGSGKSTLVPLFLAEQCAEYERSCRIVVTQPRRLAAKGLARRVSEQMGTSEGSVAGYRVGNDKKDCGACIVYVTAGHLLEALVHNPQHLATFSHVVLDEVHERFVEADFLMALLRLMLSRPELTAVRVVVMSATLHHELGNFFSPLMFRSPELAQPGKVSLPGRTPYPVRDLLWDDVKNTWPNVFTAIGRGKEPNFVDMRPSKLRSLTARRRSDQLTKLCKDMAPFCASLLCQLREPQPDNNEYWITLVFLPGLDQMREVEKAVDEEVSKRRLWPQPKVYLVHSALEEETYREALDAAPAREWRIVLSTNIAESSLTVPGVDTVVDLGFHRVNIYDDETRMSMLATEWCSKASMKQRRGRTGRTNPGLYVCLFPALMLEELRDFDESGVERSPLNRVTLEAAHLAQLLSLPSQVRAGLPVVVPGAGGNGASVALFWDAIAGGWRLGDFAGAAGEESATYPEAALQPLRVEARQVLGLLPTPPKEDRVQSALSELHELGALTSDNTPSVLGAACLKLPVDVGLARLVVLGWALGSAVEAAILAAALSLTPSCDVLRTPFNSKCMLDHSEVKTLKQSVDVRRRADGGALSEPFTIYRLCLEWLEAGGGYLGKQPPRSLDWRQAAHSRIWPQFAEKVVELLEALLRLLPTCSGEAQAVHAMLQRARGRVAAGPLSQASPQWMAALLAWGLAPAGFVAVGQTPSLYGGGVYEAFADVVREHGGPTSAALCWPKVKVHVAHELASISECSVNWAVARDEDCCIGLAGGDEGRMSEGAEFLFRICGPFNGKETFVYTQGTRHAAVRPPRHPCQHNWYMPRRDGLGMLEVRVSWKSQAETLLHVPRPGDRGAKCRPKRLLVASGGEYHTVGGRRSVMLRGVTLLPTEDGGRSALLWLLAAGVPREGKLVALAAPVGSLDPFSGDFEIRALRLWQRTLCLHPAEPITGGDLRTVNEFRTALLELQRRRPHRLAGLWRDGGGHEWTLECLTAPKAVEGTEDAEGPAEELILSGGPPGSRRVGARLRCRRGDSRWWLELAEGAAAAEPCSAEESGGGVELSWADGSTWVRQEGRGSDAPLLAALGKGAVQRLAAAAQALFGITAGEQQAASAVPFGRTIRRGMAGSHRPLGQRRWPARLVPLHVAQGLGQGAPHLAPFNLGTVEAQLAAFAGRLTAEDAEGSENGHDDDDEPNDEDFDVSQEGVNEEYTWQLAEEEDWSPATSRKLCFVESALALPPTPFCVDCEQEGKSFSKLQLHRHPDERRCKDCIAKSMNSVYRPSSGDGVALAAAPSNAPPPSVVRVAALPAYAGVSTSQVAVCSVCRLQLTKETCSTSQRQKAPTKRRCNSCVDSAATN